MTASEAPAGLLHRSRAWINSSLQRRLIVALAVVLALISALFLLMIIGLYQQRNEVLLCPCHQALFDVADGGRPIIGPASRPLPRLPLAVDGDGLLVADGPFTDDVGGGFWGRP